MTRRRASLALLIALLAASLAPSPPSSLAASPAPAWKLRVVPMPTNFIPGTASTVGNEGPEYIISVINAGQADSNGPLTFVDTLPAGVHVSSSEVLATVNSEFSCTVAAQVVTCVGAPQSRLRPAEVTDLQIPLSVESLPESTVLTNRVTVSGGGGVPEEATATTKISSTPAPFGFLADSAGLAGSALEPDGSSASQAGSHPSQLFVTLGVTSETGNHLNTHDVLFPAGGGLRDASTDLPRGVIVNPASTPVRCNEAELETGHCPNASAVGLATVLTGTSGAQADDQAPLFNMIPPPGAGASLGFNPVGQGLFIHILGGLRAGSYALSARSEDIPAYIAAPLFGIQVHLWGDPSSPSYDNRRGVCGYDVNNQGCPVPPQATPLLGMSTDCEQAPTIGAEADSWIQPGVFSRQSAPLSDLEGSPVSVSGCGALGFDPTLSARPTTNLADSPSGLEVNLHIPQTQRFDTSATAHLKKAVVTLPEGLVANPSQADGLAACSSAQIGIDPASGIADGAQPACPSASRIGEVQIRSPLLAEYKNEGAEVETDPETGEPIPRPLPGSVFLSKPFDNPFDSLLAIYVVVEDPASGTLIKLAGHVEPDPRTGQLTTTFDQNPQLPFEDFKLEFFKGARASLTSPPTCGVHTTTTDLVPWSSPEGSDAHPQSSFETTASPGGGACPSAEGQAPNAPAFSAGTLAPQAGAFSPFVLKLSREDGSQRLTGIDTTLPPGLTGKLAGIAECSDAQLAQAKARERPNMGQAEKDDPSCPSASEVGSVKVAAGSGPTPFWTSGHAYLAGPYKDAPLSLAVIVPALAGPFDLGAVVTRVALHLDPATAQIHAVSDPFPTILDGIPLDLRTVSLAMGRPDFTLNPTSCDPMQITGSAISALGQGVSLSNPFQVGGCPQLPFKPKLSLRLKGATKRTGHPQLIATVYSQGAGVANLSRVQVKLPPTAFLDQAHIRTVCTRVQFAAGAGNGAECPKGSIYGEAQVKTPLFDYTLPGTVYLRSSNHKLPDLVIALNGPASQPIAIELDGRTDSVKGALRNTFEAVPDQPFDQARVVLFGGKRGLIVNSHDLCAGEQRANVQLSAQSGKVAQLHPIVRNSCKKAPRKRDRRHHRRRLG